MTVLIVAAHPDDEALGAGATIARHTRAGEEVSILFLADGVSSRNPERDHVEELGRRRSAAIVAARILGASTPKFLDLPDNRLDSVALLTLTRAVEEEVERIRPNTVYTHHASDLNVDHRCTHEAVMTACRPVATSPVDTVLCFESPSSTEWRSTAAAPAFNPTWFVDVGNTLETKLAALSAYEEELRPWPHPRSLEAIEHLARWRGATICSTAAEAFVLARHRQ